MDKDFKNLKYVILNECQRGNIYYLANRGNWGDALIRHGTIQFFHRNKIKYFEIIDAIDVSRINSDKADKYLIYGGGSGWCRFWHHAPAIIDTLAPHFKKVIILPSTYELFHKTSNCIYFTRDSKESKTNMPHSIFCHDMAFFIANATLKEGKGNGYFYRTDLESSGKINKPKDNFDLSSRCNQFGDLYLFFDKIADYNTIHTDRLHVAIAASLLNRKTYLYPNIFFKNKAVYMSSIRDFFPNTQFVE